MLGSFPQLRLGSDNASNNSEARIGPTQQKWTWLLTYSSLNQSVESDDRDDRSTSAMRLQPCHDSPTRRLERGTDKSETGARDHSGGLEVPNVCSVEQSRSTVPSALL